MAGSSSSGQVLVVHCIDTEGPIGGDVRRRPDGSKEFMDNWPDIKNSLREITCPEFREKYVDSNGNPYVYNWFIMDFMGFKTNPKNRIEKFHDTYDNIKSLNASHDFFHWHYHQPPKSGIGDQWSPDWDESDIHYEILGRRALERNDFPEVYRAGGTIEDNKCSHWLEDHFMLDYSNRVSHRSTPTTNIFDFNWYGAPSHWGYYHPHVDDLTQPGEMKRMIARSVDLESRLHSLEQWQVDEAFSYAKQFDQPVILSYFSHDHRDMRPETYRVIEMIEKAAKKSDVSFSYCDAKAALQQIAKIQPEKVEVNVNQYPEEITFSFSSRPYQKKAFIFALTSSNKFEYIEGMIQVQEGVWSCSVPLKHDYKVIAAAGHSQSGDKFVKVIEL